MQKIIKISAVVLLLFTSVSALFGGSVLVADPTGALLEMTPAVLKAGPFRDFFIPGIVLFTFVGMSSLVIAVLVIKNRHLAPLLIIFQGIILVIWITVQVMVIVEFNALQFVYSSLGILFIFLGSSMSKSLMK
jgi:hypothetical protein